MVELILPTIRSTPGWRPGQRYRRVVAGEGWRLAVITFAAIKESRFAIASSVPAHRRGPSPVAHARARSTKAGAATSSGTTRRLTWCTGRSASTWRRMCGSRGRWSSPAGCGSTSRIMAGRSGAARRDRSRGQRAGPRQRCPPKCASCRSPKRSSSGRWRSLPTSTATWCGWCRSATRSNSVAAPMSARRGRSASSGSPRRAVSRRACAVSRRPPGMARMEACASSISAWRACRFAACPARPTRTEARGVAGRAREARSEAGGGDQGRRPQPRNAARRRAGDPLRPADRGGRSRPAGDSPTSSARGTHRFDPRAGQPHGAVGGVVRGDRRPDRVGKDANALIKLVYRPACSGRGGGRPTFASGSLGSKPMPNARRHRRAARASSRNGLPSDAGAGGWFAGAHRPPPPSRCASVPSGSLPVRDAATSVTGSRRRRARPVGGDDGGRGTRRGARPPRRRCADHAGAAGACRAEPARLAELAAALRASVAAA